MIGFNRQVEDEGGVLSVDLGKIQMPDYAFEKGETVGVEITIKKVEMEPVYGQQCPNKPGTMPLYEGQEILFVGRAGPLYAIIMGNYESALGAGDLILLMQDDTEDTYVVSSMFCIPWEEEDAD